MTELSRDLRFKIWRSKQPYFVNVIIGLALFLKDMAVLMLMGTIVIAVIAIIFLWMIQSAGNAYSG